MANNKIFATSEEKFVKSVLVYENSSTHVLYWDSAATTNKVSAADVKNLFDKGLLLVKNSEGVFRPFLFADATTYYTVSAMHMSSADTPVAELVTFKSDTISA